MEYIKPIDPAEYMVAAEREMAKCIEHRFNEMSLEEAANPEILDTQLYTKDYLEGLRAEYYERLTTVWTRFPARNRYLSFSEVYRMPDITEAGDPAALDKAYRDASRRTLWERLTRTNYKDVNEYKSMLRLYSEALLNNMLARFSEAVIAAQR